MMATLALSGIPANAKLQKLVFLLKSILKREDVHKFWIREMADIRSTDLKSARIEFDSYDDVISAERALDGFIYYVGDDKYPLSAKVDSDRPRPRRRSPSPAFRPRDRDRYEERHHFDRYDDPSRDRIRERSPLVRETSKLDLEIELLRKRRMIIEEERRLLLERKKLELVKEFGPNALKEFKSVDDRDRDRTYRSSLPRVREYNPHRSPPRRVRQRGVNRAPFKESTPKLPQFTMPCKFLLHEMEDLISKHTSKEENFFLLRLLRSSLRRRIAILLEGKPILPGAKIVTLYRQRYPASSDDELVKKLMKEVKACHIGENSELRKERNKEVKEGEKSESSTKHSGVIAADDKHSNIRGENKLRDDTNESERQSHKVETCSMGSSEALTLHDKNDEDWIQGEHGWDAEEPQMNSMTSLQ